jgi:trimethylamine--corrinoid protein Co-methyltransferase
MVFVNVSSPPNAMDLDRGRRPGDRESFRDFLKMTQYFNCITSPAAIRSSPSTCTLGRHLDGHLRQAHADDKVVHAYSLGTARVEDAMEMVRIAGGLTTRSSMRARGCIPTSTRPRR